MYLVHGQASYLLQSYITSSSMRQAYCTVKPLSPDFVAISYLLTLSTEAAEGPLFRC